MTQAPPAPQPTNGSPCGLAVLGSTGSIGTQTLDIVRLFPDRFRVRALAAGSSVSALAKQVEEFGPEVVAIGNKDKANDLRDAIGVSSTRVVAGDEGLCEAATLGDVDTVMAAVVGFAGLKPVLAAVEAGKKVALANKETLVVAGALVNEALHAHGGTLLPVDSEHSAIFQCLVGEDERAIEHIVLTASGGPFRDRPASTFDTITRDEALDHPNWSMGPKVTIDSATLMNKGLEVIEAKWLFDMDADRIEVLVHPQSIVHSMVCFTDGSVKAQLGVPDMKVPIQYALTYPARWPAPHERLDWTQLRRLDFEPPDTDRFPCLRLAFEALRAGGTAPAVLNAANEQAVALFLRKAIQFTDIPRVVEAALTQLSTDTPPALDDLYAADAEARTFVQELAQPAAN